MDSGQIHKLANRHTQLVYIPTAPLLTLPSPKWPKPSVSSSSWSSWHGVKVGTMPISSPLSTPTYSENRSTKRLACFTLHMQMDRRGNTNYNSGGTSGGGGYKRPGSNNNSSGGRSGSYNSNSNRESDSNRGKNMGRRRDPNSNSRGRGSDVTETKVDDDFFAEFGKQFDVKQWDIDEEGDDDDHVQHRANGESDDEENFEEEDDFFDNDNQGRNAKPSRANVVESRRNLQQFASAGRLAPKDAIPKDLVGVPDPGIQQEQLQRQILDELKDNTAAVTIDNEDFFEFTSASDQHTREQQAIWEKRQIERKLDIEEMESRKKFKSLSTKTMQYGGQVIVEGIRKHWGRICGGCGALIGDVETLKKRLDAAGEKRVEKLKAQKRWRNMRRLQEKILIEEGVKLVADELIERYELEAQKWEEERRKRIEEQAKASSLALEQADAERSLRQQVTQEMKGTNEIDYGSDIEDIDLEEPSDPRRNNDDLIQLNSDQLDEKDDDDFDAMFSDSEELDELDAQEPLSQGKEYAQQIRHYMDEDGEEERAGNRAPIVIAGSARDLGFSNKQRTHTIRDIYKGVFCRRCEMLEKGEYDAVQQTLEDIDPAVFRNQLACMKAQHVLVVKVVDALDFEGTFIRELRQLCGGNSVVLAVTKMDLIVEPGDKEGKELLLRWFESRLRVKGLNCVAKFAVSGKTGEGVGELAQYCVENLGGRNLFIVGYANVGKSTLVNALTKEYLEHIFYRGPLGRRRKAMLEDAKVTISALPGTTLRSIRIPVFRSPKHAMWDTPGLLINRFRFPGLEERRKQVARQPPTRIMPQTFVLNPGEILVIGKNYAQLEIIGDSPRNRIEVRWYSLLCDEIMRFKNRQDYERNGRRLFPRAEDPLVAKDQEFRKHEFELLLEGKLGSVSLLKSVQPERSKFQYGYFDADFVLLNLGWFAVRASNNYFKVNLWAPHMFQPIVRPSMPIPYAAPIDGMESVRLTRRKLTENGEGGKGDDALTWGMGSRANPNWRVTMDETGKARQVPIDLVVSNSKMNESPRMPAPVRIEEDRPFGLIIDDEESDMDEDEALEQERMQKEENMVQAFKSELKQDEQEYVSLEREQARQRGYSEGKQARTARSSTAETSGFVSKDKQFSRMRPASTNSASSIPVESNAAFQEAGVEAAGKVIEEKKSAKAEAKANVVKRSPLVEPKPEDILEMEFDISQNDNSDLEVPSRSSKLESKPANSLSHEEDELGFVFSPRSVGRSIARRGTRADGDSEEQSSILGNEKNIIKPKRIGEEGYKSVDDLVDKIINQELQERSIGNRGGDSGRRTEMVGNQRDSATLSSNPKVTPRTVAAAADVAGANLRGPNQVRFAGNESSDEEYHEADFEEDSDRSPTTVNQIASPSSKQQAVHDEDDDDMFDFEDSDDEIFGLDFASRPSKDAATARARFLDLDIKDELNDSEEEYDFGSEETDDEDEFDDDDDDDDLEEFDSEREGDDDDDDFLSDQGDSISDTDEKAVRGDESASDLDLDEDFFE